MLIGRKNIDARPLGVIAVALLFLIFNIWSQSSNWLTLVGSTRVRLVETAHSIATHTDDVYALARLPLGELVVGAEASLSDGKGTAATIEAMHRVVAATSLFRSVAYADASGRLIASTLDARATGMDVTYREYFQFHQVNTDKSARIGLPSKSQSDEKWFLPITERVNRPDGSFAGVMVATIDLEHFSSFMQDFDLGNDSSFGLMRGDGKMIMRLPIDPKAMGTSVASSAFYRDQASKDNEGNFDYVSPFDGTSRIGGFYKSQQTGVIVVAASSKSALFKTWVNYSKYPWLCLFVTALTAAAAAIWWLRQRRLSELVERRIAAREAEFRVIADSSADVIQKIDLDGRRQYVSRAAKNVFGQCPDALIGSSIYDAEDAEETKAWKDGLKKMHEGMSTQTMLSSRRRGDGDIVWLESVISSVPLSAGSGGEGYVVVTRDVTAQELGKRELNALAVTDGLTGLFNKRHFTNALKQLSADEKTQIASVIIFDLDHFKKFNDTYGHPQGDKCLREVAIAIQASLAGIDAVAARIGGEEMAVLLPGYDEEDAEQIAESIRLSICALEIPHEWNRPYGIVTASFGHATLIGWQAGCEDQVMAAADQALYRAKSQGRNKAVAAFADSRPSLRAMAN